MATKTLILRPTSVTADDESKVALYPTDTTMANAHMLVNEETPDDDATYVSITGAGGVVNYYFVYEKPEDLVTITNCVIYSREKLETGTNVGNHGLYFDDNAQSTASFDGNLASEYSNIAFTYPNTTLPNIIDAFNNATKDTVIYFKRSTNSNSSKTSVIRTTQIYIEITYEVEDPFTPDIISIKKDDVWTTINYDSVYYKANNSWVLSNTSILQNNTQYAVKEV